MLDLIALAQAAGIKGRPMFDGGLLVDRRALFTLTPKRWMVRQIADSQIVTRRVGQDEALSMIGDLVGDGAGEFNLVDLGVQVLHQRTPVRWADAHVIVGSGEDAAQIRTDEENRERAQALVTLGEFAGLSTHRLSLHEDPLARLHHRATLVGVSLPDSAPAAAHAEALHYESARRHALERAITQHPGGGTVDSTTSPLGWYEPVLVRDGLYYASIGVLHLRQLHAGHVWLTPLEAALVEEVLATVARPRGDEKPALRRILVATALGIHMDIDSVLGALLRAKR